MILSDHQSPLPLTTFALLLLYFCSTAGLVDENDSESTLTLQVASYVVVSFRALVADLHRMKRRPPCMYIYKSLAKRIHKTHIVLRVWRVADFIYVRA